MGEFFSSFLAQLLATLVGAGVSLFGVFWVFRAERRAATTEAFDQSVERVLLRVDELATAADQWQKIANRSLYRTPDDFPPAHPFPGAVSIALEVMHLKAMQLQEPNNELPTIARLLEAWNEIAQAHGDNLSTACGVFAGAITNWRAGKPTAEVDHALSVARTMSVST